MAGHASGDQGGGAPRAAIGPPRFIGRDGELDALRSALDSGTAVVLIEGEAGIGKSRLLAEFLDTTQPQPQPQTQTQPGGPSSRTLVAVCPPFRRPHTLGALVDAIRQSTDKVAGLGLSPLAGALRPLFPEWAAELPAAPEPIDDATAVRHRLFGALCELLDRTGVAVLAVEDAHCADEATLEFLLFLCARRTRRISVIVTYRPEDLPEDSAVRRLSSLTAPSTTRLRVALGPLDVTATAGLVSSMLAGAQVSPEFAQFLHQRTDGVPLAVEESIRLMGDRADLARRDGAWVRREIEDIDVPATIRDAVLERFRRTAPATRTLLEAAAVLTDPSPVGLLLAVSALSDTDAQAALDEAVGTRLLTEDRRDLLAFGHVLAGRAVYESVPAVRRRTMHRRAGIALRDVSPPPLAQLARHFRAAGDTQDWSTYAEQAADLALASGDDATASALLGELITEVRLPGATVVRLARKVRLTAPEDSDRIQDLIRSLRTVLAEQQLGDRGEAEVRAELGRLELLVENTAEGRKELERAVPHLSHDPVAAAQAMIVLGWAIGEPLPNETYLYWLRRAADMIALPMPEKDRNRLRVNRAVGLLTLGEQEGWTEVERIHWDAPHTGERLGIANHHYNLGVMALQWGHYDLARRHLASARELAERHPYQRHLTLALAGEAGLDWATGRWDGLAERLDGLVEAAAGAATKYLEARLTSYLLAAARGERLTAEQGLSEVLAGSGEAPGCALSAAAALAAMALADGDADRALSLTQQPLDLVTGNGMWLTAVELVPVRVEALIASGGARDTEAQQLVRGFSDWLRGRDVPAARAALAWCRALLAQSRGEYERAAALCARAAFLWDALPRPYAASTARERQAACLLPSACDRRDAALPLLEQVFAEYRQLGADADAARVAGVLRAHGVDAAKPRPARRGYGDRLSPRELEVAGLVIGGRTNRDIGEALYLSPRTVARHLDSAMRKLGVSSRTALAVRLVELGLGPAS